MKIKLLFKGLLSLAVLVLVISCQNLTNSKHPTLIIEKFSNKNALDISEGEQNELNNFFTSFSEIYFPEFTKNQVNDSLLIQFGVLYNYSRHPEIFKQTKTGSKAIVSGQTVSDTAYQFFGVQIKKHFSFDGMTYQNKNYMIDNSIEETFRFSQVLELDNLGDSMYSATIEIFNVGPGFTGDINANPETWITDDHDIPIPESEEKMIAVIRKIEEQSQVRYILLEYLRQ